MGFLKIVGNAVVKLKGWKQTTQELPKKVIIVGAPHTSNWDAIYMLVAVWNNGRKPHFLIKDSLIKAPILGLLLKKLGGIPVDRSGGSGLVDAMVKEMKSSEDFILAITPKGTRSKRDYWKSGFYKMAIETGLPIQFGFVDSQTKTFGWAGTYKLTGDVNKDMDVIREFYADKKGVRPHLGSIPRLRAEDDENARAYLLGN